MLRAVAILLPALGLVAATWFGVLSAIDAQRQEATARVVTRVTNQASGFQQVLYRQTLELDQTLRFLAAAWEADPAKFDLTAARNRAVTLSDISGDVLLADNDGAVVQSTLADMIGTNIGDRVFFLEAMRAGRQRADSGAAAPPVAAYIGSPVMAPVQRAWFLPVARPVEHADGSFAGIIAANWRVSAIEDLFRTADLGSEPLVALVGLDDGKLRAVVGPATGSPGDLIADTQMFATLRLSPDGTWIGHSALDGSLRAHAFRRIPGSDLAVVVGVDLEEALAPSLAWAFEAKLFAFCISVLIMVMAVMLAVSAALSKQRQATMAFERAKLTSANSQLEIAKAHADTKSAQLQATLEGMSDGVAMVDAQLQLLEWNKQFPEIAGLPRTMLRIGLPMEDILRAQAKSGQFGAVDVEAEVARRVRLLRAASQASWGQASWGQASGGQASGGQAGGGQAGGGQAGVTERTRPDGRTIELRRNRLPGGGFVTLYVDVTTRKQAEDALREAGAVAEAATEAKSRFVAIVSHEIRAPLNALLATLALLHDAGMSLAQQALLDMAHQSGDALLGLINDILEMSRMEAGQLSLRPVMFAVRPLLESVIEIFRPQAAERGIVLGLAAAPGLPRELYADQVRLRQVLINLLSNAVKFGQPGAVGLLAARREDANGRPVLQVAVRDRGPLIEPQGRERLFRPFSRLDANEPGVEATPGSGTPGSGTPGSGTPGSGLGLAICRQLVSLMGGEIGCDPWMAEDGHAGNEFWVRLPIMPPPEHMEAAGHDLPVRRILPRTRILLVDDILANQLVTATLLRREGHLVDIAADGEAALQAVARQPYDLVFMDIFMPGMSGFEVARRIRAMPAPAAAQPIVALTANASPDDDALCRDSGMNRALGKPVALAELVQALAELAWPGLPERGAAGGGAGAAPRHPILSAERVDELRSSLPGEMLDGMVEECLIDLQARLPALRRAMEAGSSDEVAAQAHAMVGMAAGYGMASLEARLRALMLAARGSDTGRAAALAVELDAELSMAADALREALSIEMV